MSHLIDLKSQRAAVLENAKILNDQVLKEGRDFSRKEKGEYDTLMEKLDSLSDRIKRTEQLDSEHSAACEPANKRAPIVVARKSYSDHEYYREVTTGEEIRAYRPDEKMAEDESLSAKRYLRGLVTGNWAGAEAEKRTALNTGTDAEGGYLVPAIISNQIVDAARNKTRVIQAGARTLTMNAQQVTIARLDTDPTVAWMAENASMSEDATTAFGAVVLSAKTVRGYVPISLEAAQDAINIEEVIMSGLGSAISIALDSAALTGASGGNNPTGLLNTSGVGEVDPDANGFSISDLDEFSDAIQDIEDANGEISNLAAIYAPRTANQIRKIKDGNGLYLASPPFWTDMRQYSTNQVPIDVTHGTETAASYAFVGDYSQMIIGFRDSLRLEVIRQATDAVKKHQIWLVASARADVGVIRPGHFSIIKGIKP